MLAAISWTGTAGDNLWHTPGNWSGNAVPTINDDVTIPDMPGSPAIAFNAETGNRGVHSLTSRERMILSGGELQIATTWQMNVASSLSGGIVTGGTLSATGGASLSIDSGTLSGVTVDCDVIVVTATLDAVTVNGALKLIAEYSHAGIQHGLTINGSAEIGKLSYLDFYDTQTLGGTGIVTLRRASLLTRTDGMTLTIGPGITVRADIADDLSFSRIGGSWGKNASVVLQGTISVAVPSTNLSIETIGTGTLTNAGTINVSAGTLYLEAFDSGAFANTGIINISDGWLVIDGSSSLASLGAIHQTGGTLDYWGDLDNTDRTLNIGGTGGSWLIRGTVLGGTINVASGSTVELYEGKLDGVTVNGDMRVSGAWGNISHDLTFNGNASVDHLALWGPDSQSIRGKGVIDLGGEIGWSATLTIGPGITIRGGGDYYDGLVGGYSDSSLVIQGAVSADQAGRTMYVSPGSLGGTLTVADGGSIEAIGGGKIVLTHSLSIGGGASLRSSPTGGITAMDNLLSTSTNPDLFNLEGMLTFSGDLAEGATQQLEAMSRNFGADASGFVRNFAIGSLVLEKSARVKIVDLADNALGAGQEAVYAGTVVVPAGCTLDLNGRTLYTRGAKIDGTCNNGNLIVLPDGGILRFGTPTPGAVSAAGQIDEWTFVGSPGRQASIVVNPGPGGTPAPLAPPLGKVKVELLSPANAVIASGASISTGQIVTLPFVTLPSAGTYRILISGKDATAIGAYVVSAYDSTADSSPLALNQTTVGAILTAFNADEWTFSLRAGQQIRLDVMRTTMWGLIYTLDGPGGYQPFANLEGDSEAVTIPAGKGGEYRLKVKASGDQTGTYTFAIRETAVTDLVLGQPYSGELDGAGAAQMFRVTTNDARPLLVRMDGAGIGMRNEMYIRRGSPPTRADYEYRSVETSTDDPSVLVPSPPAGDWYILVYGNVVPAPAAFTLRVDASDVQVSEVSPQTAGAAAGVAIRIAGAGFVKGTAVLLDGPDGHTYTPSSLSIEGYSQISAEFDLTGAALGLYTVQAMVPGGEVSTLTGRLRITSPGQANLEAKLIMPSALGRDRWSTIYVEYANIGAGAMPAPLIRLQSADPDGSDIPILTLDQSRVSQGLWSNGMPDGFSSSIQILADGATPGVLNPGERVRVPVYYVGLLEPWDIFDSNVEMELRITDSTSTDAIPWGSLKADLKPSMMRDDAWDAIYANIGANVGSTWGSFVRMLSDNASYLGTLGQRVSDVGELWRFEVEQAIGFNPLDTLASAVDASVSAAGTDLTFGRAYALAIDQRFESSVFGRGWSTPWQTTLAVDSEGSVRIVGAGGSVRRFQADNRSSGHYFGLDGEMGTLSKLAGGVYEVREQDGTVTRFGAAGRLDYAQDANGNRVTASYTGGRLTTLTSSSGSFLTLAYNSSGLVSGITDSAGRTATFVYDAGNQYLLSATGPDGIVTSYVYDTATGSPSRHALFSVTTAGISRAFTYDSRGRLASSSTSANTARYDFAYDAAGTVSVSDAGGGTTSFSYDHRGLVGRIVDALGFVTTAQYGEDDRIRAVVDPLGQSRAFTWCDCGSMTSTTDQLGNTTRFGYDYVGPNSTVRRLTSFTDALGRITRYGYDDKGNLRQTTYPDGTVERTSAYDPMGDPLTFVNRRGQTIGYTYNAFGDVTRQTFADGTFIDFAYDDRGNLTTVTEPGGKVTAFEYDFADRLTKVAYPQSRFLSFTYDGAGRRATMAEQTADQTVYVLTYVYDSAGRLWKLADGSSASPIVRYTYDAAGRLSRKDNSNGTYSTYSYDVASRLLGIVNRAPGGAINSSFTYSYNALGQRVAMETVDGAWAYTYDAVGELTHAVFTPAHGSPIPAQDLAYAYDAVGNRIRTIENQVTTNYTINSLNQYTKIGGDTLVYDADGNLLSRSGPGGDASYTYDQQGRLTRVVTPDGVWQYEYDAFGDRISSTVNGTKTHYVLDPSGLVDMVGEYNASGTLVARYVYGLGLVERSTGSAGGIAYFDFDALGNTVDLTDAAGAVVNRYAYRPFGDVLRQVEAISNPFEFGGALGVRNEGNGLSFMRARYFSPRDGRFTSPDPAGLAAGDANTYRYVWNSVTAHVDPLGLCGDENLVAQGIENGDMVLSGNDLLFESMFGKGESLPELKGPGILFSGANTVVAAGKLTDSIGRRDARATWRNGAKLTLAVDGLLIAGEVVTGPIGWAVFGLSVAAALIESWQCSEQHARPVVKSPAPPHGTPAASAQAPIVTSRDPNRLIGPAGVGPQHLVRADSILSYRIEFENYGPGSVNADGSAVTSDRWATLPAQRVEIYNTLPAGLDLDTFELTGFGFGDYNVAISRGQQYWHQVLSIVSGGVAFDVWFDASLDRSSRLLRIVFQSVDPATTLPPEVLAGFLPPEDGTRRGQGFVSYAVQALSGLPSGTEVRNIASIRFDGQPLVATNQVDPLDPAKGTNAALEALVTLQTATTTFVAAPDQLLGASAGSSGNLNLAVLNSAGVPVVLQLGENQDSWTGSDLQLKTGSPAITGELVSWVDPKDGRNYAATMSVSGLILFTNTAGSNWTFRNLSMEVAGISAMTGNLTVFIAIDNTVNIAGVAATGDLIRWSQTGDAINADFAWTAHNLADDLRTLGLTVPQFAGRITSFVTPWNALNVVGLDSSGQIQAIWWHQSLATDGKWTTNNLSQEYGAPTLIGGLTVWQTSWYAINIAGTDTSGKLAATWWVPNFNNGAWNNNNLTDDYGGPTLQADSMCSWVTPWGAMNVAGRESDGTIGVYWWVPGYNNNLWQVEHFRDTVPNATLTTGPVTGITALAGGNSMSILSTAGTGDVIRLWWSPSTNVWAEQNLTQTAVAI